MVLDMNLSPAPANNRHCNLDFTIGASKMGHPYLLIFWAKVKPEQSGGVVRGWAESLKGVRPELLLGGVEQREAWLIVQQ
jgi:hypothetical protein